MKKIGVWIDKQKAHIVTIENDKEQFKTVNSEIDDYHVSGGSGTKFKGGPQDVVQDSKYLEREKHQLKSYFKEVASKIDNADSLIIFGPANTNEKFHKELQKNYKKLSAKVKEVRRADSMTNNQVKALVRDYFKDKK